MKNSNSLLAEHGRGNNTRSEFVPDEDQGIFWNTRYVLLSRLELCMAAQHYTLAITSVKIKQEPKGRAIIKLY
jgi:hypothetical protein